MVVIVLLDRVIIEVLLVYNERVDSLGVFLGKYKFWIIVSMNRGS